MHDDLPAQPVLTYAAQRMQPSITAAVVILWLWVIVDFCAGPLIIVIGLVLENLGNGGIATLICATGVVLMGWAIYVARIAVALHRRAPGATTKALWAAKEAMLGAGLVFAVVFARASFFVLDRDYPNWTARTWTPLVALAILMVMIQVCHFGTVRVLRRACDAENRAEDNS